MLPQSCTSCAYYCSEDGMHRVIYEQGWSSPDLNEIFATKTPLCCTADACVSHSVCPCMLQRLTSSSKLSACLAPHRYLEIFKINGSHSRKALKPLRDVDVNLSDQSGDIGSHERLPSRDRSALNEWMLTKLRLSMSLAGTGWKPVFGDRLWPSYTITECTRQLPSGDFNIFSQVE